MSDVDKCKRCNKLIQKNTYGEWYHVDTVSKYCYNDVAQPKPVECKAYIHVYSRYMYKTFDIQDECRADLGHTGYHFGSMIAWSTEKEIDKK